MSDFKGSWGVERADYTLELLIAIEIRAK